MKYNSDAVLDRGVTISRNDEGIYLIRTPQTLPLSLDINFYAKENDILKVFDWGKPAISKSIKNEGLNKATLNIDINGICSLKYNEKAAAKTFYIPKKLQSYHEIQGAVGIDFGTTECCAAVIRKNGPDFVVLDEKTGFRTMPSYVAFDEKMPKCGQIVIDRMRHKAKYSVYDIKRIIGKSFEEVIIDFLWPFEIKQNGNEAVSIAIDTFKGKCIKTPEEIAAALFYHIKLNVETYQGKNLEEAVIAIPTVFTEKQKVALKKAANLAGWKIVHFIPEPVAAAFAYFTELKIPNQSIFLICDCGGVTTDICVAKMKNKQIKVLNFDVDLYLGGRDFDTLLFIHFSAILKHKYGIDVMKNDKKYILKQKCQDIKHRLSSANEDWLDVSDFDFESDEIIKISREEFEAMTADLLLRIRNVAILWQKQIFKKIKSILSFKLGVAAECQ